MIQYRVGFALRPWHPTLPVSHCPAAHVTSHVWGVNLVRTMLCAPTGPLHPAHLMFMASTPPVNLDAVSIWRALSLAPTQPAVFGSAWLCSEFYEIDAA